MARNDWTLRRRLTLLFAGSAVLATLALVGGIVAFSNVLNAREQLVDRVDPAAVTERDFLAAMVDQETGVRGFTLTGDETFLEPYLEGNQVARDAVTRLRELLAGEDNLLRQLEEANRLADVWREEFAEPEIARVRLFGASEATDATQEAGRARFQALRTELEGLEASLSDVRDAARGDLNRATKVLIGALSAIVFVVLLLGIAAWIAFRRWTMQPIERLAEGARTVADGDLHHELDPGGPPELARLGHDVEAMRRRIASEVAQLETAQSELSGRARDLARSNADLEQFAYVASHDLQEPLRKVTSFCQLLQRRYADQLDERANQYIDFAVDGARRMQILINDLLTFSRVGRTSEKFVPLDMNAIVRRAVDDLDEIVTAAGGHVEVGDLPTVSGDATLMLMLFRNVIGNAIKFRGVDPPIVEVTARPTESGDQWCFVVSDNGIGIEPEYAEKVFVIFQRLHSREQYEGTGIGLALAKRIVEFHGGEIWLDTARQRGTAVSFTIPPHQPTPVRSAS